ncbi:2-C-methyl-D-erythritol 4-phosphate cytidylyltransferase [Saccharobesus litoralis]|uniref:2-C-methyl-D-erythritol 4-phosphate cytidylyltransferase n=1 Tax=Saccharobesus litoralis TaxID=2172099 RepID=A0A2S0VU23_9ALTE|nr:2-C-methyl-D-erythritol 4-phosphate cytidylyltransferase [Saccharobesus litoralis]AWB67590.1 2-C-methyl-D-erythritol 4-phosphate cytidylyltransferase [Saccharobesus litoralis]
MLQPMPHIVAIIPAAGVGSRMKADIPKQYLTIGNQTILEHTLSVLDKVQYINEIVLVVASHDSYLDDIKENFCRLTKPIKTVVGGQERVDSVLAGLNALPKDAWALVHDAARPCVLVKDIEQLIETCLSQNMGGILASRVKDTMKRSIKGSNQITETVSRDNLWHALTPQLFPTHQLVASIELSQKHNATVTDEASAIEFAGGQVLMCESSATNLKITTPDDLQLATLILNAKQM